jgi:hypothetical protein
MVILKKMPFVYMWLAFFMTNMTVTQQRSADQSAIFSTVTAVAKMI